MFKIGAISYQVMVSTCKNDAEKQRTLERWAPPLAKLSTTCVNSYTAVIHASKKVAAWQNRFAL